MDKEKKDTYYFYKFKKKIDTSSISSGKKKSYLVEKKKPFRTSKPLNRKFCCSKVNYGQDFKKKNFARKFVEQQATKDFIKKENKPRKK